MTEQSTTLTPLNPPYYPDPEIYAQGMVIFTECDITFNYHDESDNYVKKRGTMRGLAYGYLGILDFGEGAYSVTHLPSGDEIFLCDGLEAAKETVKRLTAQGVDLSFVDRRGREAQIAKAGVTIVYGTLKRDKLLLKRNMPLESN